MAEQGTPDGHLGVDLLLSRQVAQMQNPPVSERTVQRWIQKGLPAYEASREQLGQLVAEGLLTSLPPHKVYLIRRKDLALIPQIRASARKAV